MNGKRAKKLKEVIYNEEFINSNLSKFTGSDKEAAKASICATQRSLYLRAKKVLQRSPEIPDSLFFYELHRAMGVVIGGLLSLLAQKQAGKEAANESMPKV